MIGRLRGTFVESEGSLVLVECAGVGYEVQVPDSVLAYMPPAGEEVTLLIRQIFREDGVSLYGFLESFQRRLFDLLMTVKGCGPKVGLSLIGTLGQDAVAGAIQAQDARGLARAPGVGARLAERIILELREKIGEEQFTRRVIAAAVVRTQAAPTDELVDALLALGYRRSEAENAALDARENVDGVEEQLRHALRVLKK
ncbi:MAG: Holliday junction branch migration protein RuvA [Fimbriimonadaceae bacterium]|nr:Holliday junction branch migration protein RuvA [Fimbriimonadaceae bacterium]